MAGRKRTPDALKVIKGTDQPVRMSGDASYSIVITKAPAPPKHLSKEAKKVWKSVAREMVNMKLLTTLNVMTLSIYADLVAQYIRINEDIELMKGNVIVMNGRNAQLNPLIVAKNMTIAQIMKLSTEFGFTQAAQSRIMGVMKSVNEEENDYMKL